MFKAIAEKLLCCEEMVIIWLRLPFSFHEDKEAKIQKAGDVLTFETSLSWYNLIKHYSTIT